MTTERPNADVTKPMIDALETTAWGMEHFGGIITNRQLPLSVMRQCVKAGLCKCIGMGIVCDADGFAEQPERERLCYVLTDRGIEALDAFYVEQGFYGGRGRLNQLRDKVSK